jgi:dTDP-4-dehydrorhamnose reductase
LGHAEADICDEAAVANAIRKYAPTSVVNAAAYTDVNKAESEPDQAFRVNRDGARVVAKVAAAADIPLIHLSTDYVFDGRSAVPYTETDRVAPLGVYGRSKKEGERAVRASAPKHLILRTAGVYSPFGINFVRTMLRLGSERAEIQIVDDQTGSPTSTADIAAVIMAMVKKAEIKGFNAWGTYHFTGAGIVSWYGFAKLIFEEAARFGIEAPRLSAISSTEYPTRAPRPAYSVLDNNRLELTFGIRPRPLQESLTKCLKRLLGRTKGSHL